ncbi:MAG: MarR family winged helix-turn-helix transcriptional regulator [Sphingomonas sp.]
MPVYTREEFNPDVSVGYLTKRIYQSALVGLEPIFVEEGISHLQWSALVSIWYDRGPNCRALAQDLGHDKGATTRLVDTLEERGFVARDRDADDRRVVNLVLTDKGRDIAERCMHGVVDRWNGWLDGWSTEDAGQFINHLQRLRTSLEASVGDDSCA